MPEPVNQLRVPCRRHRFHVSGMNRNPAAGGLIDYDASRRKTRQLVEVSSIHWPVYVSITTAAERGGIRNGPDVGCASGCSGVANTKLPGFGRLTVALIG